MRHAVWWGALTVALATAVACSTTGTAVDTDAGAGEDGGAVPPPPPVDTPDAAEGPAGTGANTGLPCDVQVVTENRCIACHDGKAAVALLTYSDFMRRAASDPTKTLAQVSLDRMKSATRPMPPPPAAPPEPDEIQVFEDWIKAGTPRGAACTTPPPDGGTLGDAGPIEGGLVGDGGCTSGTFWTGGNMRSALMNPGEACLACHQVMGGPNLRVAGTVYPTLHEPNKCNGSAPPPQLDVVITDNQNRVIRVPVNAAGNFDTRQRYSAPYKAAVTDGTKTRTMIGTVTSGDCNACHTQAGTNGAPGRILAP
jgi:hypothetical protein